MTAIVSFFEFVDFERLQLAPASKTNARKIMVVLRIMVLTDSSAWVVATRHHNLNRYARLRRAWGRITLPVSTPEACVPLISNREYTHQSEIDNRKSAMLQGDYSLDVTRGVDVPGQSILHRFKRGVTVCDKGGDIDPLLLNEIQGTQVS